MLSCHGSLIPRRACVIVLESAAFMRHIQYRASEINRVIASRVFLSP